MVCQEDTIRKITIVEPHLKTTLELRPLSKYDHQSKSQSMVFHTTEPLKYDHILVFPQVVLFGSSTVLNSDCHPFTLQNGVPVHDGGAHEHHSISRHSRWRGVVYVMNLKDNLTVGCHGYTVTVCQGQCLVVIKDGVEVLDPDSIDWTIK